MKADRRRSPEEGSVNVPNKGYAKKAPWRSSTTEPPWRRLCREGSKHTRGESLAENRGTH
jgi:hypothetical protein